jgi:hypothetical protein
VKASGEAGNDRLAKGGSGASGGNGNPVWKVGGMSLLLVVLAVAAVGGFVFFGRRHRL